ncbi:MAG: YdcF family protein [Chloroflexi bacterium]|nr:YdcF family protein [Chloroflexota bacterium]
MIKIIIKMALRLLFWLLVVALIAFGIPRLTTEILAAGKIFSTETSGNSRVAIVFGAGVYRDGTPSPILKDRVSTAANLYFEGKVQKILMSGDNRFVEYNEPRAMQLFAIDLGVPEADIVLDYAGRRTYDTCYRAKHIFGLQEAILVTQRYHLPRALFTCNGIGIKSTGAIADQRKYQSHSFQYWTLREIPASLVAMWEVWVSHPLPILGDPEPIFINEGSK